MLAQAEEQELIDKLEANPWDIEVISLYSFQLSPDLARADMMTPHRTISRSTHSPARRARRRLKKSFNRRPSPSRTTMRWSTTSVPPHCFDAS